MVDLTKAKSYLRVDGDEENTLIQQFLDAAIKICTDVARDENAEGGDFDTAVLYATAYFYEHREDADHRALTLTLRSLLFGKREAAF